MEERIKENLFVMTRNLTKDYHWVCKPSNINISALQSKIDNFYSKLNRTEIFTSEWYHTKLTDSNFEILFRIVVDGRKDMYGRLIRRYEGAII